VDLHIYSPIRLHGVALNQYRDNFTFCSLLCVCMEVEIGTARGYTVRVRFHAGAKKTFSSA
jgi:hypothetical protein